MGRCCSQLAVMAYPGRQEPSPECQAILKGEFRRHQHRAPASPEDYAAFFLRSAHRFFIISDKRFLPAALSPPRRLCIVIGDGLAVAAELLARLRFAQRRF